MNYHDVKKMIKSFVKPSLSNDAHLKDDELVIESSDVYPQVEDTKPLQSMTRTFSKTKLTNKYVPPGGFDSYRGISIVHKPNREPMQNQIAQIVSSTAQLEKDKLNREAINKVNDISKLLLKEFEAGRLVLVEPKPESVSLLTRVKEFLRIK